MTSDAPADATPEPSDGSGGAPTDPVLAKRAQVQRWVDVGQRVGYGLFGIAVVAFFVGFVVGFTGAVVTLITFSIVVGSLILAPAIVFGYGVKAANRADREDSW